MDFYEEDQDLQLELFKDGKKAVARHKIKKIVFTVLKLIGILICVAVYGIIFLRMGFMKTPKAFKDFTWTDNALAVYESSEDFDIFYGAAENEYDDDGLYHVSDIALSKAAGELQLTVRYNSRSTLDTLMTLYGLSEKPTGETFVYILRDDLGNEYTHYLVADDKKPFSEFRRIVFDGVNFEGVKNLYLAVYYGEDVSADAPMNAEFVVYNSEVLYEVPDGEIKPKKAKFTLYNNPAYINNIEE